MQNTLASALFETRRQMICPGHDMIGAGCASAFHNRTTRNLHESWGVEMVLANAINTSSRARVSGHSACRCYRYHALNVAAVTEAVVAHTERQ